MNEPDTFIVTVQTLDESFVRDMELPSGLPVSALSKKLLDALKSMTDSEFINWTTCQLECNNKILNDDDTLLKAGVFDGSRVVLLDE